MFQKLQNKKYMSLEKRACCSQDEHGGEAVHWRFFFVFTICKHLFFGRSIWPLQRAYVMANLNTGQAFLKSSNTLGFRGVAQACWSIETLDRSAHYLDFRNRKSVLLCYYQTATNFFHSVQNARNFIWPYCWVLKSRWCQCLRGYESYWD